MVSVFHLGKYIYLVQIPPEYIYLVQSTSHSVFVGLVVRVLVLQVTHSAFVGLVVRVHYVCTRPLGFQQMTTIHRLNFGVRPHTKVSLVALVGCQALPALIFLLFTPSLLFIAINLQWDT